MVFSGSKVTVTLTSMKPYGNMFLSAPPATFPIMWLITTA